MKTKCEWWRIYAGRPDRGDQASPLRMTPVVLSAISATAFLAVPRRFRFASIVPAPRMDEQRMRRPTGQRSTSLTASTPQDQRQERR
jgi:hypothetical protein